MLAETKGPAQRENWENAGAFGNSIHRASSPLNRVKIEVLSFLAKRRCAIVGFGLLSSLAAL